MLGNDDFVKLVTAMLNIGLASGMALDRQKQKMSIMHKKDPGQPRLDQLRIIQLFKSDYNFLLATMFGHRLMVFIRRHCSLNDSQYGSMSGKQAQSAVLNKFLPTTTSALSKKMRPQLSSMRR